MEISITRVSNGYVASYWKQIEDEFVKTRVVFEENSKYEYYEDVECFANLLRYLTEYFEMTGSKHDDKRINITTENK